MTGPDPEWPQESGHAARSSAGRSFGSWCLLDPEALPARWRARAVLVALVPLLPKEAASVLRGGPALPELGDKDEVIVRLLAEGTTISGIAREVGMSVRGVQKRIARLRDRFGAGSTMELRTILAGWGL